MAETISAHDRVLAAFEFRTPDRVPRFDTFWVYPDTWRQRFGPPELLTDMEIWVPDESMYPTRARRVKEEDGWIYEVEPWGALIRRRPGGYFTETLEVPVPEGTDPDDVHFDDPLLESRYLQGAASETETLRLLAEAKRIHCIFGKTGGPYLRTTFVRGEAQFLMDMAGDPGLARALAEKVADHLIAIGREQLRRWDLADTGIGIYDDMAHNRGPMFSPRAFERILLPAYRRMIAAYKAAGARYVFLHSDGDIRPLLDMLVDAGIDGLNPLERRAGMAIEEIRRQYPRLVLTGGMCNTDTLLNGPVGKIRDEARRILDLGRDGGIVIGTHSISPEVPPEHFAAYLEECGHAVSPAPAAPAAAAPR
jgi:uroporphyrinogen-III decarboxylase